MFSLVVDDLDELGKVPRIPFPHPHHKSIDILVESVEQGNCLDDHIVHLVYVELDLGAGVRVGQAELGLAEVVVRETVDVLSKVVADASENFSYHVVGNAGDASHLLDC